MFKTIQFGMVFFYSLSGIKLSQNGNVILIKKFYNIENQGLRFLACYLDVYYYWYTYFNIYHIEFLIKKLWTGIIRSGIGL